MSQDLERTHTAVTAFLGVLAEYEQDSVSGWEIFVFIIEPVLGDAGFFAVATDVRVGNCGGFHVVFVVDGRVVVAVEVPTEKEAHV